MPRFPAAFTIASLATIPRIAFFLPSTFNPSGDWGAMHVLAHPINPGTFVEAFDQGKFQFAPGRWAYFVSVRNPGPTTAFNIETT